jgi:hypothetical protein
MGKTSCAKLPSGSHPAGGAYLRRGISRSSYLDLIVTVSEPFDTRMLPRRSSRPWRRSSFDYPFPAMRYKAGRCGRPVFDDPDAAKQLLATLRSRPHIDGACIYRSDGTMLASYSQDGTFLPLDNMHDWRKRGGTDRHSLKTGPKQTGWCSQPLISGVRR